MKNLALLIFGILIGLVIAESVTRIIYTRPWYVSLLEKQTTSNQETSIRQNSLGLRGEDYPAQKPPNAKRVLILGDSFTFGSGVTDDSAIFPELLKEKLHTEFDKKGEKIEILNGGLPSSLTNQWVDLLLTTKDSFQPDVILIVFFLRDGTRTSSMGGFFTPIRNELKTKNKKTFLYRYSYLFRMYQDSRDRTYLSEKYSRALNESYLGDSEQTQEWKIAKANILKIRAIGEAMGAKVGLIVFPVMVELNDNYPFREICKVIAGFGTENGISTHSLLTDFMGKNGPDLWVSSLDQHPNAVAHEIAANSIAPFLRQLLKSSSQNGNASTETKRAERVLKIL